MHMPKDKSLITETTAEQLAELQAMGGGTEGKGLIIPAFRLEHTTDFEGNDNPLKGHFTLTSRNDMGEFETQDLGAVVELQPLVKRYRLFYKPKGGNSEYSSREFDSMTDQVQITKKTVVGDSTTFELFATGDARTLQNNEKFLTTTDDGKIKSELALLTVLYIKVGDTVARWKMNISATIGFKNYTKVVREFSMVAQATPEERKNGSVKYFAPIFKALRPIDDVVGTLQMQKDLREAFAYMGGSQPATEPQKSEQIAAPDPLFGKEAPKQNVVDGEIPF